MHKKPNHNGKKRGKKKILRPAQPSTNNMHIKNGIMYWNVTEDFEIQDVPIDISLYTEESKIPAFARLFKNIYEFRREIKKQITVPQLNHLLEDVDPDYRKNFIYPHGGHTTQRLVTKGSYKKYSDALIRKGKKGCKILDASSGWGLGTEILRKNFIVDDVEPFPSTQRKFPPTYTSYDDIPTEYYDVVISNAVLCAIERDTGERLVKQMVSFLKDEGILIINTRSVDNVMNEKSVVKLNPNYDDAEILTMSSSWLGKDTVIKSYMKGRHTPELQEWIKSFLEDDCKYHYVVRSANLKEHGLDRKIGTCVIEKYLKRVKE